MLTLSGKLLELFTPRERWRLLAMLVAVLVTAAFQTFAVASILPFMAFVEDPAIVSESAWLAWLYTSTGVSDTQSFLVLAGVLVLALLVLGNAFSGATTWWLLRFAFRKNHDLSTRLLAKYLSQPYTEFLDRNTAELSKNILSEVMVVVTGVLIPGMYVFVRGTMALFMVALLVLVDATLAISVLVVLGGAYGVIYAVVRGRQARFGRARMASDSDRYRMAAEALGGVKEIQALGRERAFVERFAEPSRAYAGYTVRNEVVGLMPRYAMETVAIGGILLIVITLLARGPGQQQLLPTLSVYAYAGYKLLPALQQLFESLTTVRFYEAALDTLRADLVPGGAGGDSRGAAAGESMGSAVYDATEATADSATDEPPDLPFHDALVLNDVSFTYPGAPGPSLRDVSLTVARGSSHGLVGGTGSGKTTLVDLVLGLLVPERGTLEVDGRVVSGPLVRAWRRRVGYVPQEIFLADDSLAGNIAFGLPAEAVDPERVRRAAGVAQLDEVVAGLPGGLDTVVGERGVRLSGGQRQRIGIARALYHDPDVLILDEGTSALDGATEARVIEALRALDPPKTLIIIAHRLASVRDCDQVHLIEGGRLVASGGYQELLANDERFRALAREKPAEEVAPA